MLPKLDEIWARDKALEIYSGQEFTKGRKAGLKEIFMTITDMY